MHSTRISRPRLARAIVGVALLTSSACQDRSAVRPCTDMPHLPAAVIDLRPQLAAEGRYTLEVEADGQTERCSLSLSNVGPATPALGGAMVAGPSTRAEMACKLLQTDGISSEGHLASLSTKGTPAKLSIRMVLGEKEIAKQRFDLSYVPTELNGAGCQTTPRASGTLKLAL